MRSLAFAVGCSSLLTGFGGSLSAQMAAQGERSALPATPPTSAPAALAPIAATAAGMALNRPQNATVSYGDGLLDVRANNSSLNAILREVARATGMKVTGSIADQRVFGNYGPAAPATVLATLLDGTGSNMLLREGADASPAELILTPRTGGPSPPSPPSSNTSYNNDENTFRPDPGDRNSAPVAPLAGELLRQQRMAAPNGAMGQNGQGNPNGFPTQIQANQTPNQSSGINGSFGDSGVSNGTNVNGIATPLPSTGTAPAGSSNGDAKTPEQVYQMLQQLRQQSIQEQNGKQQ